MSSTLVRMALAEAEAVAARFIDLIEPCCWRVQIAGSIRRRLPTIGDVEVIAVPKTRDMAERDMFGEQVSTATVDLLDAQLATLLDNAVVAKRPRSDGKFFWGPKAKYLTFEGVNVDLFTPDAARWGLILMIRTGPAAYSHQLVTERGKVLVVGHGPDGRPIQRVGMLPPHLKVDKGWLTSRVSGQHIPTPEETDFFREIGLPWREPQERR